MFTRKHKLQSTSYTVLAPYQWPRATALTLPHKGLAAGSSPKLYQNGPTIFLVAVDLEYVVSEIKEIY